MHTITQTGVNVSAVVVQAGGRDGLGDESGSQNISGAAGASGTDCISGSVLDLSAAP